LEAGLAVGETRRPRHLPSVSRRRHHTEIVEICSNHPAQEAR
jgi:hypothetical protein